MKRQSALLALAIATAISLPVMASGDNTPKLDEREANLQRRIDEGLHTGSLTPGEAASLQERLNKLNADEAAAKKNGKVSEQEHARLKKEADNISNAVYASKQNARTAAPKLDVHAVREQERIDEGVKSGKLTAGEAADLQERQNKLKADEAAAKADGKLTEKEREKLRAEEKRNGAAIHQLKNNERKNPDHPN